MARKAETRQARNTFWIITNGEQTEKNYFDLLKSKQSIYDVKVKFINADPLGLVECAQSYTADANQVWCVFDIDNAHKDKRLIPALQKAEQESIKVAYSNIAFEVWLISHFQKCAMPLSTDKHKSILDHCLKERGSKTEYTKSDKTLFKKYFIPDYKQAVENAKIVYQSYVKTHRNTYGVNANFPIWEWNSSTTVYKLIEALKLQK